MSLAEVEASGLRPPVVAILPYGTRVNWRLAQMPLDKLSFPLGMPASLRGKRIADLGPDDHLIAYLTSRILYMPRPGVRAAISVMVTEPKAIQGRKMAWLRTVWRRFRFVLTRDSCLLAALPNAVRFASATTWVPDWREIDATKTNMTSLIASSRANLEGHILRHRIVDWLRENPAIEADIMGRGYRPFDRKSDGLAPYRFSVIIENVREPSYFTEKLIDCLLCNTVPIYWGAPDIGEFFDTRGMLICNSADDIKAALARLTPADYDNRRTFIEKNRELASAHADHELNAARLVQAHASDPGNPQK
ncbi:MAG: hypothetical protein K8H74_09805 [Notoacmeibacter sp.]|nr:hypothetical protein [Notoacmeibacter sp.]